MESIANIKNNVKYILIIELTDSSTVTPPNF